MILAPSASPRGTHVLILYTTLYRKGGPKFVQAARTLEAEKRSVFPGLAVERRAVESKAEFLAAFAEVEAAGPTCRSRRSTARTSRSRTTRSTS